jgi:histidinol-phosphate phosphatase family protein
MDITVFILLDELYAAITAKEGTESNLEYCVSVLSRQVTWLVAQGSANVALIDTQGADADLTESLGRELGLRAYSAGGFAVALRDTESAHCMMLRAGFPFGMELSGFFAYYERHADGLYLALRLCQKNTPATRYVFWGDFLIEVMKREDCFAEKYVYGGFCLAPRAFLLENLPQANLDTEYFRQIFNANKLYGFPIPVWNYDPAEVCADAPRGALFLDRDGVLLEDTGYVSDSDTLVYNDALLEGLAGCACIRERRVAIVIVSNQAGIAKGLLTHEDVDAVNSKVRAHMQEFGLTVDGVWYCPYHIDGEIPEFSRGSLLRKPSPGMFLLAAEELRLDLARSLMVGDNESDRIELPYLESFLLLGDFPHTHEQEGGIADLLQVIARKFGEGAAG